MRAVKNLYLGNKPETLRTRDGAELFDPRHASDAILDYETMQAFGGYWDMMRAPHRVVERTRLVLQGKGEAEAKKAEDLANSLPS